MKVVAGFLGGTILGAGLGYIAGYAFGYISFLAGVGTDGLFVLCVTTLTIIGAMAGAIMGLSWGLKQVIKDETKPPE